MKKIMLFIGAMSLMMMVFVPISSVKAQSEEEPVVVSLQLFQEEALPLLIDWWHVGINPNAQQFSMVSYELISEGETENLYRVVTFVDGVEYWVPVTAKKTKPKPPPPPVKEGGICGVPIEPSYPTP